MNRLAVALVGVLVAGCTGPTVPPASSSATRPTAGAAAEATTSTTPVATIVPSPSTAAPKRRVEGGVEIVGDPVFIRWGDGRPLIDIQVIQEIRNPGRDRLEVGGEYTLLAKDGALTQAGELRFAAPNVVGPGETGYVFDHLGLIHTREEVDSVGVGVRSHVATDPAPRFEVSDITIEDAAGLVGTIHGTDTNTGTATCDTALVTVLLFDATGRIRGFAYDDYGAAAQLAPGRQRPFSADYVPPIATRVITAWKVDATGSSFPHDDSPGGGCTTPGR